MSKETSFKLFGFEIEKPGGKRKTAQKWSEEEHRAFLEGLLKYGKGKWTRIACEFVKTRTSTQVASHAQKYYQRKSNKHPRISAIAAGTNTSILKPSRPRMKEIPTPAAASTSSILEPSRPRMKETPTPSAGTTSSILEPSMPRVKETSAPTAGSPTSILKLSMPQMKETSAPATLNLATKIGPAVVHKSRTREDGVVVVDPAAGAADHRLYTQGGFQVCYVPVITYPDGRRYLYRPPTIN